MFGNRTTQRTLGEYQVNRVSWWRAESVYEDRIRDCQKRKGFFWDRLLQFDFIEEAMEAQ